jgi:hypothetical protein
MSTLKPGATYIYERADGIVYAREFGSPASTRQVIGYDYNKYSLSKINDVVKMCETDPAMQELLDQLLVLYNLKKTSND